MTERKIHLITDSFTNSRGELVTEVHDGKGNFVGYVAGEGEERRRVVNIGEAIPGYDLVSGQAETETGFKLLEQELEDKGAKPVGRDTPEPHQKTLGWSPAVEANYFRIFGHN